MNRPVLVAVVALALVFAGCNGFVSGDDTPTEAVTPVAVPTDEPTPTPVPQLAPGLKRSGVTDPFALGEAHAATLDDRSFTVHSETTIRLSNGSRYRHDERIGRFAANRSRYDVSSNGSGSIPVRNVSSYSIDAWSDGSRLLTAQQTGENTSYEVRGGIEGGGTSSSQGYGVVFGSDPASGQSIYTLFGAVETRVVGETTRNGTTSYELAATNVTNPVPFTRFGVEAVDDLRNVSFRAQVTPKGLVREYRIDYGATVAGEDVPGATARTIRVHRVVRYTDLGTTTVERPPWYDEAIANASTAAPTTG